MHLSGETEIAATRQRVWETISNPTRATASNSQGQAQIEKIDDRHYRLTVSAPTAMGAMTIVLELNVTDLDAPSRIGGTIEGAIMGGPINGTGAIDLVELEPKVTRATYQADVTLGGLLGGFDGMMAGPVQQSADQAFIGLKERLEAEEVAAS
jgi:carbon monoxide dehydrogenase subunit G